MVQPSSKREGFVTVPDTTWDDVGALEDVREELSMAILVRERGREGGREGGRQVCFRSKALYTTYILGWGILKMCRSGCSCDLTHP